MLKTAAVLLLIATPAMARSYGLDDYNNGGWLNRPFDSPMPSGRVNPELTEPNSYRAPQSYGSIGKTPPPSYRRCVRDPYNGALVCY